MDIQSTVATIMLMDLFAIQPNDTLEIVKNIFEEKEINHIPVIEDKKLLGIVSKVDFLFFVRGKKHTPKDMEFDLKRLKKTKAKKIMKVNLPELSPNDTVEKALELFELKRYRCIPVLEKKQLVGLITPLDILKVLNEQA